jgi:hypothetical protein
VRVNDNAQPAAHVNPAVAVNAHGAVVVAWYDRRAHNNPVCHSLWIAASIDGGRTFSKNRPVTDVKTCIQSQRFANGGDTLGLVADAVGAFHTAFISGANPTEVQLYAARLILDSQQRR